MFYAIALLLALVLSLHLLWPHITGKGAGYGKSARRAVEVAFKAINVRGKTLYELGCGYGSVLVAAYRSGARAVGVEIDPIRALICKLRCPGCTVIRGDMFNVPLEDADIVYIFQWPSVNERLAEKFNRELRRDALVISYYWEVPNMELVAKFDDVKLYIYRPRKI